MNLPHSGHGLLFNKALKLKEQNPDYDIKVFLSRTQNIKNPLPYNVKVEYIKKLFPEVQEYIHSVPVQEIFSIMKLLDADYDCIKLLVGSDRTEHFSTILQNYNNLQYEYRSIEVIECGNRDVNDLSGTKMRSYVYAYDFDKFSTSLPQCSTELKTEFFNICKMYMRNEL